MSTTEVLAAIAIAVGLVGVLVPILPGSLLVLAAIVVWAVELNALASWLVLAVAVVCIGVGTVVRYTVPGKRLKAAGVPNATLLLAAVLGVVGFFVVPVVGLPLGFVLGVYLGELRRLGSDRAWPATVNALKAVGLGILIELVACLLATAAWVVGVVVT